MAKEFKIESPTISSDFFEIKMLRATKKIWDDHGSKAVRDVRIWKSERPAGFYTFGHQLTKVDVTTENPDDYPVTIALKPKPGYEDLISLPVSFTQVWNSDGSGTDPRIYIFRAICPPGYVALGMVALPYDESKPDGVPVPRPEECACIKTEYAYKDGETIDLVSEADYVSESADELVAFWDDKGSKCKADISLWLTKNKGVPDKNYVELTSNSFFMSEKHYAVPPDVPYALSLKFNIDLTKPVSLKQPELLSPVPPTEAELQNLTMTNNYEMPFFLVHDDKYKNLIEQALACPIYSVNRVTRYKFIDSFSCPLNGSSTTFAYSIANSTSHETNWDNTVGASVSVTVEAEGSFKPIGIGGSLNVAVSVEANYSHSFGGSETTGVEITREYTVNLNPGQTAVILQEISEYAIYRIIDGKRDNRPVARSTKGTLNQIALYHNSQPIASSSDEKPALGNIAGITAHGKYFVHLRPDGRLIINSLDDDAELSDFVKKTPAVATNVSASAACNDEHASAAEHVIVSGINVQ